MTHSKTSCFFVKDMRIHTPKRPYHSHIAFCTLHRHRRGDGLYTCRPSSWTCSGAEAVCPMGVKAAVWAGRRLFDDLKVELIESSTGARREREHSGLDRCRETPPSLLLPSTQHAPRLNDHQLKLVGSKAFGD